MNYDFEINCIGDACPVPIVKTAKKMREMSPGQILKIASNDEGFKADIVAWSETTGNEFLSLEEKDGIIYGFVKKAS
jgi:tRNA 2-thiouridine synthesizing protein A